MALKATIYKAELQVADLERHYYQDHNLTLARHPSETDERMMVRLLAFAHNAHEGLEFGKGLSDAEEPDLWQRDLTGAVERWIEAGLPDERRILKACGRADQVVVYAYGGRAAELWWNQVGPKLARAANLTVFSLPWAATQDLSKLVRRTMRLQATIQEGQVLVTSEDGSVAVDLDVLRRPAQ
jgi:Uncharacterized protein conserved in bacteria